MNNLRSRVMALSFVKVVLVLILFTTLGRAQMSPKLALRVNSIYEKISLEATEKGLPPISYKEPASLTSPAKTVPPIPNSPEEFSKLLSESKNPRELVGTSPLLTNPLIETSGFFEPKESDSDAVKQEMEVLSKLRELLLSKEENFDATPFVNACKSSGSYWIEVLLSQQTSDGVREKTFNALLTSPYLFSAILTSPQSRNDPETLRFWAARFSPSNPLHIALLLTLANAHPSLESEVLKPMLPPDSLIYTKLLNESPPLATEADFQVAFLSLVSPNGARKINTATLLAKIPATNEIGGPLLEGAPEIRSLIFNHARLAALKEIKTPQSLSVFHRRLAMEATELVEKSKHFAAVLQTGFGGKECMKLILSLPEAAAIIEALPLNSNKLGALLQELDVSPSQLQVFAPLLRKHGENAKKGNLESQSLLLLVGRNPNLQEIILPILTSLFTPEIAADLLRINQGQLNAVMEDARQGKASALEAIHVITLDERAPMRQLAFEALGTLANIDPKARELVISMAKDKNPLVRQLTVIALGSKALRKKELLTVLLDAAKDPEPMVREAVASSLIVSALRSNAEATQALADLAENDPQDSVKTAAIKALGNASTAGNAKVMVALKKLTTHSNPVIAQAAKEALAASVAHGN